MSVPPLSERCELLSERWIATADQALRAIIARRGGELGPSSFVLRETFSFAPPHLQFASDHATCVIEVSATPSVRASSDAAADLIQTGEYQHWMPLKQAVGNDARARAGELAAHLYGRPALTIEGTQPTGVVASVLDELQDHMARRTVENPDVAHRAQRQKIEHHVSELEEQGFTIVPSVIPAARALALRSEIVEIAREEDYFAVLGLPFRGPQFVDILLHPLVRTLVDSSIGLGATLGNAQAQVKQPGPSVIPLHTDYSYIPEPFPEFPLSAQTIWAMDDWAEASGPTWMVPGSHKRRRAPVMGVDKEEGGVPLVMPAGSVCLFSSSVWHWATARTEEDLRVSLHTVYNRPFMRGHDNYTVIDEELLEQHSPLLSTLLCQDDPFEKTGSRGMDWNRAAYTAAVVNWGSKAGRSGDERYEYAARIYSEAEMAD